ncbi:MAG: carbohydrate ABC transporter permease [Acidimicrobiales bacterium]|nr:carbohydrate ABC transporter permease [Acidimicrobiales bacterium]
MAVVDIAPDRAAAAASAEPASGLIGGIYRFLSAIPTWILWLVVIIWTTPTLSLFVNSFRGRDDQRSSVFWGITPSQFSLENYDAVWNSQASGGLREGFVNSFAIAIPATIIPIAIAAFAAYAFAWIDFRGREGMFIGLVSLLAIPNQVALLPLLQTFASGAHLTIPWTEKTVTLIPDLGLQGTSHAVWLSHTSFALPFAVFLLHNYMKSLPADIFESARIDGADHFTIFWRLVLPLSVPVLAAFGIFQFLWTWNDFLIATTMLGSAGGGNTPLTIRIAALVGEFGRNEHLLTAGAFVMSAVPLLVFFALQKYFVRGLLAGSVKG